MDVKHSEIKWQPIETAPKDGTHILLYRPEIQFAGFYAKAGWIINAPDLPIMEPTPIAWQSLPAPPESEVKC